MPKGSKVLVICVMICAAVLWTGVLSSVMGQGSAGPARLVVIGCLKKVAPQAGSTNAEFTITDFRGGPMPTVRLDANDSKLIPWVGYTVEITGRIDPGYRGASKQIPKLNVEKVDRISRSCTALEPTADVR